MRRPGVVRQAMGAGILLALWLFAACTGPAPQPLRFEAPPWQDGEQSTYLVLSDGRPAGAATMSVTSNAANGSGWSFRRETSSLGGQEIVSVEMSEPGFRPRSSTLVNVFSDGAEQVRATWDRGEVNMELVTRAENTTYQRVDVPTDARDQRTLPLLVRALPLAAGYATDLNAFLPYTGRLERVRVQVEGRETVNVAAGAFDTWRVLLTSPEREIRAWVGVDAPHPLVRLQEGDLVLELEQVTPSAP